MGVLFLFCFFKDGKNGIKFLFFRFQSHQIYGHDRASNHLLNSRKTSSYNQRRASEIAILVRLF